MSPRGKKTGIVVQSGVMIPQDGVPVLKLQLEKFLPTMELVATTLNFLRCGCPAVQWISGGDWGEPNQNELQIEFLHLTREILAGLEVGTERFELVAPDAETFHWPEGTVISVSRLVAPKIRDSRFGAIRPGGHFLTGGIGSRKMMKVFPGFGITSWRPSGNLAMYLDHGDPEKGEPLRGTIVRVTDDMDVLEILE